MRYLLIVLCLIGILSCANQYRVVFHSEGKGDSTKCLGAIHVSHVDGSWSCLIRVGG